MGELNEAAITKLATITGIDATAVAITTLYTVPPGKTFVPDHTVTRVTAFTAGGKDTQAVVSFGGNSATWDDYINSATYTVAAVDKFIRDSVDDSALPVYAGGATFKISVETASNADVETWAVDVFGYLY